MAHINRFGVFQNDYILSKQAQWEIIVTESGKSQWKLIPWCNNVTGNYFSLVTSLNLHCIVCVASLIFLQIRRTWSHCGSFYCVHKTEHYPSIEYCSPSCRLLKATLPVSPKPSVKYSDFQASPAVLTTVSKGSGLRSGQSGMYVPWLKAMGWYVFSTAGK